MSEFRGQPLTQAAAREIFIGHLDHVTYRHRSPEDVQNSDNDKTAAAAAAAAAEREAQGEGAVVKTSDDACGDLPWSWKVVCGANPVSDRDSRLHPKCIRACLRGGSGDND